MRNLIFRRLVMVIPILLAVSIITFILQSLAPGDAALTLLGANATPESLESLREELGLNLPWYQQWFNYVLQLVGGSMGNSVTSGADVMSLINERMPVTLSLIILSTLFSTILGLFLGALSAIRKGASGKAVDVVSMLGLAIPNFVLALVLVSIFAVQLRWFPAIGYSPLTEGVGAWAHSLALPALALTLAGFAVIAKTSRDSMLEVQGRDFMRTLRANGVSRRSLLFKHAAKNASGNVVTVVSLTLISGLTGAVFVESIFALPGVGMLATSASQQSDIPVVQGVAIYFTLIVIVVNLLVDIIYGWLNPKARTS